VKLRVGEAPPLVLEREATVVDVGRRCSDPQRLVVSVKSLVV
jgi:hypothetical protein